MTGPQYPQQPYGQPYPPQQPYPPRKRKVWPWILLAVAVLVFGGCVAIIGAAGNEAAKAIDAAATSIQSAADAPPDAPIPPLTPKPAGKGKTVVYEIISDSDLRSVTYWDENSELQQLPGADAPWTMTLTNTSTYAITGVGAQTNGTSVTCRVTVDGKVKDEKTSTGKYAVVNCTG
ncbi:MmpS family transport accessory protein [Nocardia asiatica]|uniref:MmpS family transport accessory protein n=1 Tax=Nocardia asiatica TaxID=209252 RepID=UPI00245607D4|nr:MmpS family transport accessory protein [Nocardia asiatica]